MKELEPFRFSASKTCLLNRRCGANTVKMRNFISALSLIRAEAVEAIIDLNGISGAYDNWI